MTISGLIWMPSSYTATWLHSRLSAIFGASLVGLWIGEDLVVDGSNNATSWPGRVGTLNHGTAARFSTAAVSGRRGLTNPASNTTAKSFYTTLNSATSVLIVAQAEAVPTTRVVYVVDSTTRLDTLAMASASSVWGNSAGVSRYGNGLLTSAVTTSVSVYEAACTAALDGFTLGAQRNTLNVYPWAGSLFAAVAVSSITPAQRILATAALKRYYGLTITPQESLAEALATIYGSALAGLWIGDDLIVSGSDVTSWPGRAGGNLAPIVAGTYRTRVSSGGRYYTTSPANTRAGLQLASSDVIKSWVVVAEIPTLPFGSLYPGLAASVADNHAISGNASNSDLYTGSGWSHKINGVSGESLSGLAGQTVVVSGEKPTEANTGFRLGCHGSNAWPWATKVGAAVALNAVHSAGQLPTSIAALKAYYSIP